jgi:hypothetical protein
LRSNHWLTVAIASMVAGCGVEGAAPLSIELPKDAGDRETAVADVDQADSATVHGPPPDSRRTDEDAAAATADGGGARLDAAAVSSDAPSCVGDAQGATSNADDHCSKPDDAGPAATLCRSGGWVHPGALHSQAQIDRIKAGIAGRTEPYASAWTAFHPPAPGSRATPPVRIDATNPYALQDQGHTMYLLAVYWALSGDAAYGTGAAAMLNAWASTFTGPNAVDATLRMGLGAIQMINAAELLRHANGGFPGFTEAHAAAFSAMLGRAVYPTLHGAWTSNGDAGWGTPSVAAMMAAGIFAENCAWVNEAVEQFKNGTCVGIYQIVNDGRHGGVAYIGENAETGRDQAHVQGTVAHLAETAEMGWNQGIDLYGEGNSLLLAGMEYNAKYNLGNDVPFTPMSTCTTTYGTISTVSRGAFSPVYEMVWNHYHNRRGLPATYTGQVRGLASYAPEISNSDHGGLGTLLYSRPPDPAAR